MRLEQEEIYSQTIRRYRTLENPAAAAAGVDVTGLDQPPMRKRIRE